jgi:competence protein ComEC
LAWHRAETRIIPECATGVDLAINGQILAADRKPTGAWSLDVRVMGDDQRQTLKSPSNRGCQSLLAKTLVGKRLLVRWRAQDPIQVGERWLFTLKLRVPWGAANPGGFDYRRWLLASGYSGTGYVKKGKRLLAPDTVPFRPRWVAYIRDLLERQGLVHSSTLLALVTGNGSAVDSDTWDRYRRTGAIHLLVVSGLHVSVLAVVLFASVSYPLRLISVGKARGYAQLISALVVCLCAVWFVWFTGAGSPVMRVAGMLVCLLALRLVGHRVSFWRVLIVTLVVSTLILPLQVFHAGFWLSYGAVAALVGFFSARHPAGGAVSALVQAQIVLSLGLSPLLVLLLGEASLLSMPANFVTVPIVTLVTVPMLFCGVALGLLPHWLSVSSVISYLSALTLQVADFSLALVDVLLTALLHSVPQHSASVGYVGVWTAMAALAGGVSLLMPLSVYARVGLLCAIVPLGLQATQDVRFGEVCVRVVDVGQGSAAVIDTAGHRLLVDTGPRFGAGDVGRSHILPVLRSTGPHDLDLLLLSHTDLDHAGGMAFFRSYFDAVPVIGPDSCAHGHSWRWDGVRFTTLQAVGLTTDNDRSCTLLLETERHAAYLSGDISALAEHTLLSHLPTNVTFLLAPHHGSASSSSMPFVRHVAPEVVAYSAGRNNHYGHPHPRVVRRYAWEETRQLNTAVHGAIEWCSSRPEGVRFQRQRD